MYIKPPVQTIALNKVSTNHSAGSYQAQDWPLLNHSSELCNSQEPCNGGSERMQWRTISAWYGFVTIGLES